MIRRAASFLELRLVSVRSGLAPASFVEHEIHRRRCDTCATDVVYRSAKPRENREEEEEEREQNHETIYINVRRKLDKKQKEKKREEDHRRDRTVIIYFSTAAEFIVDDQDDSGTYNAREPMLGLRFSTVDSFVTFRRRTHTHIHTYTPLFISTRNTKVSVARV